MRILSLIIAVGFAGSVLGAEPKEIKGKEIIPYSDEYEALMLKKKKAEQDRLARIERDRRVTLEFEQGGEHP